MRALAILALGLAPVALAGCGGGGSGGGSGNVTQLRAANAMSDQLKGMSDLYRNLGLRRAILDSGQKCKRSEGGAYQQDYKNLAMWTTSCVDTGEWAIFIAPGGEVQVRRCADEAQLGLPACQARPSPAAAKPAEKGKAR
jgi:hypothetical protein